MQYPKDIVPFRFHLRTRRRTTTTTSLVAFANDNDKFVSAVVVVVVMMIVLLLLLLPHVPLTTTSRGIDSIPIVTNSVPTTTRRTTSTTRTVPIRRGRGGVVWRRLPSRFDQNNVLRPTRLDRNPDCWQSRPWLRRWLVPKVSLPRNPK